MTTETYPVPTTSWSGAAVEVALDAAGWRAALLALDRPCHVVRRGPQVGLTTGGQVLSGGLGEYELLASVAPLRPESLGSAAFRAAHGVAYAYHAGAMANGISSAELVIALGQAKLLGSFGAGGLPPQQIESAIHTIQAALPNGPYAFNLIHSPNEEALERRAVELFLERGVQTIEASAFLALTGHVVRYRVAGLRRTPDGQIEATNKVIAKLSRGEVAAAFLGPAPARILGELQAAGLITAEQAALAAHVPMADDITVEADSGGHTDNRPLVCLLPAIQSQRDEARVQHGYPHLVRVGAGGGIGTPAAALATFMMGADYIVTGSVNQACLESGSSPWVRAQLAAAEMADVMMAPAADMFEMGVKLQVLKRGTLFPVRAQKLYEIYRAYDSLDAIPAAERSKLERQIFRRPLAEVWGDTEAFFAGRDPEQLRQAEANPKRKMALVFRWYLGLSSRWANSGEPGRETDYQIWCGPAMGAFNSWVRGSHLEQPEERRVVEVARQLMVGAAYQYRTQQLQMLGIELPGELKYYKPQ
ncbi:PfaD family polyunsaturated fatty acid/polyketide biosynthesis protein [Candidatus Viridilinea mediisalina]|uniref:2-nitropropane dioxygenase n=1 Tax=Candidatus Viridilinea mediisalina TaxID=2024553 RepID=A0A2A6RGW9_9CHLR|nr:PfaD family polyunsaturated fatty acid/polyketide biosynthesis protein [Candidatus Viridilinea mediisalina]PDW02125.1 2-nitropropane dioxygenase [Candidatus Viridilinea mediisalina]